MAQLKDTHLVFIAGVEGSGTTMMSQLLEQFSGYYSLGGNHCSIGFEAYTQQLNDLTAELWSLPAIDAEEKQFIASKINALSIPDNVQTCVYKRSYPFLSSGYMPDLADLSELGLSYKVVLLRRHFMDNVRSIMRRGFEHQESIAIQRIAQGYMFLTQQLMRLDKNKLLILDYEKLIDERTKMGELERLALFFQLDVMTVQGHANLIGRPTSV